MSCRFRSSISYCGAMCLNVARAKTNEDGANGDQEKMGHSIVSR